MKLRLISTLAERAASHPSMEAAVMGAVRATLPGVIEGVLRDMFQGEQVRLYVPKRGVQSRTERNQRIVSALDTGEAWQSISKRENVSRRLIFMLKKQAKCKSAP